VKKQTGVELSTHGREGHRAGTVGGEDRVREKNRSGRREGLSAPPA